MSWEGLKVVSVGEDTAGLYPLLDDDRYVMAEPDDGAPGSTFKVMDAQVDYFTGDDWERVASIDEGKIEVTPTESRLIFYCRKWSHGGYIGTSGPIGLVVLATTAAVSGARAAARNRGNALAGHVRWGWVMRIGFQKKTFWRSPVVGVVLAESVSETEMIPYRIATSFRLTSTAEEFRDSIIAHCRSYHHTFRDSLSAELREAWDEFDPSGQWAETDKGMQWLDMPSSTCIGDPLAHMMMQSAEAAQPLIPPRPSYPPPPFPPRLVSPPPIPPPPPPPPQQ
ncbi:hypothetical protein [Brevibacterium spongiae]|uniref:Uncharacterized protein n=1 Tax=Brevibacterium spongiae TaxID=2909672 RepID=A0ABY5SP44_9MICO|nr:hypothetical protein [Brevibacterium spongiae]UVI36347.1 hypothetical protein L1F31_01370 [Brevibacterium spongiae]